MKKDVEKKRAVLFDFDYTLADTSKGIAECINFALAALGFSRVSYEVICKTIGMPLEKVFKELGGGGDRGETKEFIRLFTERGNEAMERMAVLYDAVPGEVERLRKEGFLLGIVSTKFRYRIEGILKKHNLLDAFSIIVGGEDVKVQKPDPFALRLALKKMNVAPASAWYIGDSTIDAQTAENAGVPFVAVLYGVTKREEFGGFEVIAVCENMQQVSDAILHHANAAHTITA